MANDLIDINNNIDYLTSRLVILNLAKRFFLLNVLQEDSRAKKKYIRSQLIAANNQILTLVYLFLLDCFKHFLQIKKAILDLVGLLSIFF
jgi:hypothetical protein